MSDTVEVCPEGDLQPGERTIVDVGGRPVGVFNLEGEYYALLNQCRHQQGPLCAGEVRLEVKGAVPDVGEHTEEWVSEEDPLIECPWHGWTYRLDTGEHSGEPALAVPTYEVVVEDGMIQIHTG